MNARLMFYEVISSFVIGCNSPETLLLKCPPLKSFNF